MAISKSSNDKHGTVIHRLKCFTVSEKILENITRIDHIKFWDDIPQYVFNRIPKSILHTIRSASLLYKDATDNGSIDYLKEFKNLSYLYINEFIDINDSNLRDLNLPLKELQICLTIKLHYTVFDFCAESLTNLTINFADSYDDVLLFFKKAKNLVNFKVNISKDPDVSFLSNLFKCIKSSSTFKKLILHERSNLQFVFNEGRMNSICFEFLYSIPQISYPTPYQLLLVESIEFFVNGKTDSYIAKLFDIDENVKIKFVLKEKEYKFLFYNKKIMYDEFNIINLRNEIVLSNDPFDKDKSYKSNESM